MDAGPVQRERRHSDPFHADAQDPQVRLKYSNDNTDDDNDEDEDDDTDDDGKDVYIAEYLPVTLVRIRTIITASPTLPPHLLLATHLDYKYGRDMM